MTWKIGIPDARTGLELMMMPGQTPYTEEELKLLFGLVRDAAIADVDEESEWYAMCDYFERERQGGISE